MTRLARIKRDGTQVYRAKGGPGVEPESRLRIHRNALGIPYGAVEPVRLARGNPPKPKNARKPRPAPCRTLVPTAKQRREARNG